MLLDKVEAIIISGLTWTRTLRHRLFEQVSGKSDRPAVFLGVSSQIVDILRKIALQGPQTLIHYNCCCVLDGVRNVCERKPQNRLRLSGDRFTEKTTTILECWPMSDSEGISAYMWNHPAVTLPAPAPRSAEFWCVSGAVTMALPLLPRGLFDETKAPFSRLRGSLGLASSGESGTRVGRGSQPGSVVQPARSHEACRHKGN